MASERIVVGMDEEEAMLAADEVVGRVLTGAWYLFRTGTLLAVLVRC